MKSSKPLSTSCQTSYSRSSKKSTEKSTRRTHRSGSWGQNTPLTRTIRKLPDSLQCRIIFQDGSEHIYRIPTVRVQSYSLEEIHEKHLNLFIPYLLLRLKPRITSKRNPLSKKELTEFLENIILILQEDLTNGYLTRQECSDYLNLLSQASERIFYHHPSYHEEVKRMTKPLIYLPSMQLRDLEAALAEKDSEIASLRAELAALSHS